MQTNGFLSIALMVRIGLLAGGSRERLLANHQLRSVQPLRETLTPHMTFAAWVVRGSRLLNSVQQ